MTEKTRQNQYGPIVWVSREAGLNGREAAAKAGLAYSASVVSGLYKRQRTLILDDARDLKLCELIDAGESDTDIALSWGVSQDHVAALRSELETR